MNILKKYLAMFLVICMMVSAVPVSVFASETDGTVPEVTDVPEITEAPETTDAPEITEAPEVTEEPETTEGCDENETFDAAGSVETPDSDTTVDVGSEDKPELLAASEPVNVTLWVGQTKTFTDNTGNYENHDNNKEPEDEIATMEVVGKDGVTETTVSTTKATTLEDGATYIIRVYDTDYALSSNSGRGDWKTSTRAFEYNNLTAKDVHMWTLEAVEGGYKIKSAAGYLNLGTDNNQAYLNETGEVFTFTSTTTGWTIGNQSGRYINALGGLTTYYSAGGWTGDGTRFDLYKVTTATPGSTDISFTGVALGETTAVVGNTTYNITVVNRDLAQIVDVALSVGETKTYTDDTGNYENHANNMEPNDQIATMEVVGTSTGGVTIEVLTSLTAGADNEFYIEVNEGTYLTNNCGTTTDIDEAAKWYAYYSGPTYCTIRNVTTTNYLSVGYDGVVTTTQYTSYTKMSGGKLVGYYSNLPAGTPVKITGTTPVNETIITFEGVAPGKTTAVVGNTQYNITVTALTVNIELEVGETFTYLDTTGVFTDADDIKQQPDGTYATMDVKGAASGTRTAVTAIESGKRYLIVNKNTGEVLTDTATVATGDWGNKDALATIPEATMNDPELWTITESNGKYSVVQNGKYLAVAGFVAYMYDTQTLLTLTHTDQGWMIYDSTTGPALNHGAGFYLSDNVGDNYSGSAQGTANVNNAAIYWDIVEVPYTDVIFTGVAPTQTPTTAKVGNTTYNITVVPQETDDEVENTQTDGWTVDPEIQSQRITAATVENAGYTDETWQNYQDALTAANEKMAEVTSTVYTSADAAQAALDTLKQKVNDLEAAKNALVPGKPITIRYWHLGTKVLEETITVPADAASYTLPSTKTHNGTAYTLGTTELNLVGGVNEFDVQLLREGYATEGIVGSANINATAVEGRPVKEMTVTEGITYDLDLADILTDGQGVEWSSNNTAVATVDKNGVVTAVAEGTAAITATIKDADGNVVKTYETTVNVLPGVAEGAATREIAVYIDRCEYTTATCVIHANGAKNEFGDSTNKFNAFAVVDLSEGELLYGAFQSTNSTTNSTDTTGFTGLTFFGNPDNNCALGFMSSTNSSGQYMPLHDSAGKVVADDGTPLGSKYYISGYGSATGLHDGLHAGQTSVAYSDATWTGQVMPMAKYFTSLEYDGAMGFNRPATHGSIYTNLSFVSDPMPEVEKVVDGVLPVGGKFQNYQRYVPNMVAAVDEIVFFKITVTLERPVIWAMENGAVKTDSNGKQIGAITYTDTKLIDTALENSATDEMDAYFYSKELDGEGSNWNGIIEDTTKQKNIQDITDALNAGWADDEEVRVLEYYVVYKIQPTDIPKFNIANVVQLQYNYTSSYSSGSLTSSADADADITVIGEAMDNVVIDFGQSIVITGLTNRHLKGVFVNGTNDDTSITQCKVVADYGTATVTREHMKDADGNLLYEGQDNNRYPQYEYTVTYTPTKILQAPDMVRLYGVGEAGKEKIVNGFIVYPATTVYYEEGFAFTGEHSGWNMGNSKKATVNQELEMLGISEKNGNTTTIISNKMYAYGYDPIYENAAAPNDSYAESIAKNSKTVFEFTGDGIQIFANCTTDTGYVAVEVRDKATNRVVRMSMVDTAVRAGDTNATIGQIGNMDALPVVSLLNIQKMPHSTYKVTISKAMDSDPVYIDGIRIFNTIAQNDNDSPFTIDLEDRPDFYELRDAVLHAVGVQADTTEDYQGRLTQQIYDSVQGAKALIFDESVDYANSGTVQDLLDNGPKNELFIYPNQTLSFKVKTNRVMQVGLKAPQGATKVAVTVNDSPVDIKPGDNTISSSVDMFYYLVNRPAGVETEYTVSIQNKGEKMLSVTLLKICDDPNAAFEELTKEDIEHILESIYGKVESILGNLDDDGDVDVDDVLSLLWNVLFPEDYPIRAEADFDGNGTVDVDDVLALLWYVLFPEEYPLN